VLLDQPAELGELVAQLRLGLFHDSERTARHADDAPRRRRATPTARSSGLEQLGEAPARDEEADGAHGGQIERVAEQRP
jgi:hypothetical protein